MNNSIKLMSFLSFADFVKVKKMDWTKTNMVVPFDPTQKSFSSVKNNLDLPKTIFDQQDRPIDAIST